MGFKFNKKLKIGGIKLNVTKKGLSSVTVGGKFFKANVGKRGLTTTSSLPGTGLSYQTNGRTQRRSNKSNAGCGLFILFFLVIALLSTFSVLAQKPQLPPSFPKGTVIVPKFSTNLVSFQKVSAFSGKSVYSGILAKYGGKGYSLQSKTDWKDSGWATMNEFVVEKMSKEKTSTIFECRANNVVLRLEMSFSITNFDEALKEVFFIGSLNDFKESEYYQKEIVERYLPRIFSGKLANLSDYVKIKLVEGTKYNIQSISGEDFKGNFYLSINVGFQDSVYNTIQVNQSERVAKTVESFLNDGTAKISGLSEFEGIDGLKIITKVGYADFLREGQFAAHYDEIEAYFPFDALIQYKNADITNQQLIDKCFVLVNGNRVQVSLTQYK